MPPSCAERYPFAPPPSRERRDRFRKERCSINEPNDPSSTDGQRDKTIMTKDHNIPNRLAALTATSTAELKSKCVSCSTVSRHPGIDAALNLDLSTSKPPRLSGKTTMKAVKSQDCERSKPLQQDRPYKTHNQTCLRSRPIQSSPENNILIHSTKEQNVSAADYFFLVPVLRGSE